MFEIKMPVVGSKRRRVARGLLACVLAVIWLPVSADERVPSEAPISAVPSNPMKDAYFGEQHIHTAYSLDALIGGTRLTPFDAYRFSKGAEVDVNGAPATIQERAWSSPDLVHALMLGLVAEGIRFLRRS
jgi:hypothetical protein